MLCPPGLARCCPRADKTRHVFHRVRPEIRQRVLRRGLSGCDAGQIADRGNLQAAVYLCLRQGSAGLGWRQSGRACRRQLRQSCNDQTLL